MHDDGKMPFMNEQHSWWLHLLLGATCDCGRYRKVVGQLDVTISKLRSAFKFIKAGEQRVNTRHSGGMWEIVGSGNYRHTFSYSNYWQHQRLLNDAFFSE